MSEARPHAIHRKDYRPPSHWIDRVDLEFELGEQRTVVRARLVVRRNPFAVDAAEPLRLHGERLKLNRVAVDGRALSSEQYVVTPRELVLLGLPAQFELETEVEIEPQNNTELSGLYRSGTTFCTQCEAEGFRRITYFLDRPDVMAVYTTTIIADGGKYPVLLANGNRVEESETPEGRTLVRWHDPFPKPSYLFALVAADLRCQQDRFVTRSGREVRLELWVDPENIDACDHALRSLKRAMKWDEEVFGLEYDLDIYMIVAVNDFNMAAMENKGLNIFNAKYVLARPETATDDDYETIEGVIGHEYFHNWTGNRVTCRDWFQLTLKEGLTVFRDEQFTADMTSAAVKRITDVNALRTAQFAEDQSPAAHPIRPDSYIEMNNFYTVTVYSKGAEVVRMMHTLLGPEAFARGLALYLQRYDGQAVTCDDFRAAMAEAGDMDLEQFGLWYAQAGTPVVEVEQAYDAATGRHTLTLRQRAPANVDEKTWQPMHIPVAVGLLGADGADQSLEVAQGEATVRGRTALVQLRAAQQQVVFTGVSSAPVLSALRGFSAPVKLRLERTPEELALLMTHDTDAVSRWDAGQTLAEAVIMGLVADRTRGRSLEVDPRFVAAFGAILGDDKLDGSLRACMMALPDERVLAQRSCPMDIEGIHECRWFVLRALARAHQDLLLAQYQRYHGCGDESIERDAVNARRAKNAALTFLCALGSAQAVDLARIQFRQARNMTDAQAALVCLVDQDGEVGDEALEAFYERWQDHPVVLDKWFSVQATSRRRDTLARVKTLGSHPDFSLRNPNRVRSLIGAFSTRNPARFHDATGAGYALLADHVVEIDGLNPQLAARLITPFMQWRRLDTGRAQLMKDQLQRIAAAPRLSEDVFEMVSKALGQGEAA